MSQVDPPSGWIQLRLDLTSELQLHQLVWPSFVLQSETSDLSQVLFRFLLSHCSAQYKQFVFYQHHSRASILTLSKVWKINGTFNQWLMVLISCSLAESLNEIFCDWKHEFHLLLHYCFHLLCVPVHKMILHFYVWGMCSDRCSQNNKKAFQFTKAKSVNYTWRPDLIHQYLICPHPYPLSFPRVSQWSSQSWKSLTRWASFGTFTQFRLH